MKLKHLIQNVSILAQSGEVEDLWVEGIAFDSRKVQPGYLFVAIPGTQVDGWDYVETAVKKGAVAIITQRKEEVGVLTNEVLVGITVLAVEDAATTLAEMAEVWYNHPSQSMKLIGVTGTNGKTTVTTLLHDLFTDLGFRCGLLSTVEVRIGTEKQSATHTTPDALAISSNLAEMREAGVDYVFMEVSSHAMVQQRTRGLQFAGGIFTNMSHDHLDYHGSFKAYIEAKKSFFDQLPKAAFALVNIDDKRGEVMIQNCVASKYRYSLRQLTDFHAKIMDNSPQGLHLVMNGQEVFTQLLGRFNAYNLLAAFGAATALIGEDASAAALNDSIATSLVKKEEILTSLSRLKAADGRLDILRNPNNGMTAVVDYAHTPDALENVLETLRDLLPKGSEQHKLICVVGAGGDRDRTKRPEMAKIAARLADYVILTSDNPRTEDPNAILDEMEAGLEGLVSWNIRREVDRRKAIQLAIQVATPQSIVLVAGKGHETYQEIKGERFPFDDKAELTKAFHQQYPTS